MTNLKGKTLFITGSTRGIGYAIAERAAKDGSNIAIEAQMATTEGLNFEDNGQLVWYGVDGNALRLD